jgi:hypothetical protein
VITTPVMIFNVVMALFALVCAALSWRNMRRAQRNAALAQENLEKTEAAYDQVVESRSRLDVLVGELELLSDIPNPTALEYLRKRVREEHKARGVGE